MRAIGNRLQDVDTSTNNCVFVRTTLDHPDDLLAKFLSDVHATRVSKTRFILRIFPVLGTCRAVADKIEKLAEEVLAPFVSGVPGLTYCIVYKVRCNSLSRDEILPMVGRVALKLNPEIKVNFDKPELVVSVDVLQKFCCISVMRDFHLYKKYNVQEMCKEVKAAVSGDEPVGEKTGKIASELNSGICAGDEAEEKAVEKVESVESEELEPTLRPDTELPAADVKAIDVPEFAVNVSTNEADRDSNLPASVGTDEGVIQESIRKNAIEVNSAISADSETQE